MHICPTWRKLLPLRLLQLAMIRQCVKHLCWQLAVQGYKTRHDLRQRGCAARSAPAQSTFQQTRTPTNAMVHSPLTAPNQSWVVLLARTPPHPT